MKPLARLLFLFILLLTACSTPTSTPVTATEPATAQPATATEEPTAVPPTETPLPTETAEPTATATTAPTATPQPTFGAVEDGLSAFCLPEDGRLSDLTDVLNPPAYARQGELVEGALEINNLPVLACTFLYTFNGPAPEGMTLELYETKGAAPWWTAKLEPVASDPNTAAVTLRHSYIIAPPLWNVSFEFAVKDADGTEIRRDPVNLHRWTPSLCFNGRPPNPITLRCPLWQDLHPWDAGYGENLPTLTPQPEED